jgi:hypothetical protein
MKAPITTLRLDTRPAADPPAAERYAVGDLPTGYLASALGLVARFAQEERAESTSQASQRVLAALAPRLAQPLRAGDAGGAAAPSRRLVHVVTQDGPPDLDDSLGTTADLDVWRPCDAAETAAAWVHAVGQRRRSSLLLLSRRTLAPQRRTPHACRAMLRGGYVLSDRQRPRAVVVAGGAEVELAMAAQRLLDDSGLAVRVVSLPSPSLFERQDAVWRAAVLGHGLPHVAVEFVEPGSLAARRLAERIEDHCGSAALRH